MYFGILIRDMGTGLGCLAAREGRGGLLTQHSHSAPANTGQASRFCYQNAIQVSQQIQSQAVAVVSPVLPLQCPRLLFQSMKKSLFPLHK